MSGARSMRRGCGQGIALGVAAATLVAGVLPAALGPRYGGSIRVGVLDLPGSAEPAFTRGFGSRLLLGLRHESLIRLGRDGAPEPAVAARWSASASRREWRIEIDTRATFQNGRPVTADDAVRSLRRFLRSTSPAAAGLAPALDGGNAFREGRTEELAGLGSDSAETLWLRLETPAAELPASLAAPAAAVTAADGSSCGPFVLVHAVREERAAFVAFNRHVGGRPFLDDVEIRRFPDHDALRLALAKGAVDVGVGEPGMADRSARLLLVLDASRPVFQRVAERAVVAAAFDRRVLTERFLPGSQPLCSLFRRAESSPDCEKSPPLVEAPRPSRGASLTLVVDAAVPASASQRVVAHLMAAGYGVTVSVKDGDAAASGSIADARLLLWAPEIDTRTQALAELARLPSGPGAVMSTVLTAVPRGPEGAAEAEQALLDSAVVIPLAAASVYAVRDPRLEGARETPTGRLGLEDAWLAL